MLLAGILHYTLPQKDVVRIVNTYEERQELNDWTRVFWSRPDAQSDELVNRDVQFIQTVQANGRPMVYRNEDTGWSWPPYFKFDTANLYTQAADSVSAKDAPEWYVITHYGWRNEFLSVFPNAVALRAVAGPDAPKGTPWVNIIVLLTLGVFAISDLGFAGAGSAGRALIQRWRGLQDNWEAAGDAVEARRGVSFDDG